MWYLIALAITEDLDNLNIPRVLIAVMIVCWIMTYILIILRARRDKKNAMPYAAMCANFSWEIFYFITFLIKYPDQWMLVAGILVWVLLDVVIVWQYLFYGRLTGEKNYQWALIRVIVGVAVGLALNVALWHDFYLMGAVYSAFVINLIMSDFFINMLVTRGNSQGQSLWIATLKLIGTLAASLVAVFNANYRASWLLMALAVLIFIFDVAYIYMLKRYEKEEKPHPTTPVPA